MKKNVEAVWELPGWIGCAIHEGLYRPPCAIQLTTPKRLQRFFFIFPT